MMLVHGDQSYASTTAEVGKLIVVSPAKVGAGSLVTSSVPSRRTIVGVPGTLVGATEGEAPAFTLDHALPD